MTWIQPIPTSLREEFGDDHLSRLIYQELLLMACNTSQVKNLNGQIITLERGQCYYTTSYFSKIFNRDRKSITTSIKRLIRTYNRMDNRATPKGSIATLLNYDEIVGLHNRTDNRTDNRWTTDGQQMDTNKSDKNVKPAKNTNYPFESFWELYQRKGSKKLARDRYQKLTEAQRELIFQHVPKYQASREKRYWKDAERYISHETWESEIVDNADTKDDWDRMIESIDNQMEEIIKEKQKQYQQ